MKFDVRYVHKVSQICKCGCTQYSHRRPRRKDEGPSYVGTYTDGRPMVLYSDVWGDGACTSARCAAVPVGDYDGSTPCLAYEPRSEERDLDLELDDELAELPQVRAKLRAARSEEKTDAAYERILALRAREHEIFQAMTKRLVEVRLLGRGEKLFDLRREADGKVVVFPKDSCWHSIILTPVRLEDVA